jgi:glycosyltransferase involved in cell wall biosynthesis
MVAMELARARCLAFPSLWYETFGLVVDEAAAMGIPAIVSDISAAAERVENGVTGWHMRSGDAGDLAQCLEATRDNARLTAMGQAAYDRFWRNPPTAIRHVEGLMSIYDQVLAVS